MSKKKKPAKKRVRKQDLISWSEDLEHYIHSGVSLLRRELYLGDITNNNITRFHKNLMVLESISGTPITIHINSPGGDEDAGWAAYDILRRTSCYTVAVCWGNCSSMATIILQACDKRLISPHCSFMIHEGSIHQVGSEHIRNTVSYGDELKRKLDTMATIYSQHSKLSIEAFKKVLKDKMGGDWHLNSSEVIKFGFADEIIDLNKWPKPFKLKRKKK